jgi:hypothetical protein
MAGGRGGALMSVLPFPTPDAQLVKATLAVAEAEALRAQLEHVRARLSDTYDRLDSITYAAQRVKEATTSLERDMALSLLLARALEEVRECSTCDGVRRVITADDRNVACPECGGGR